MPHTKHRLGDSAPIRPFTGREKYLAAFTQVLGSRDLERHQVLVYYGVGGIGKTSIIKELRRSLNENHPGIAHAQIDLRDKENLRPAIALIRLRGVLNELYSISFPTFDIAYSLFWKLANPHLPLSKSQLRFLDEGEIAGDVVALLEDVPVLGIAAKLPRIIEKHGRKALAWWRKRGQRELGHLSALDAPQDVEDWLPAFFSADLKAWIEEDVTRHAVIFLDTFEALWEGGGSGQRGAAPDAWVREWVAHLNGVLVVIAGRSKLYWQDEDEEWASLIEQHLVGEMAPEDCDKFLLRSGVKEGGVRAAITTQSGGVPFYLDLAVDTYELIQRNEERLPKAEEFDENLGKLLDRFLHYLSDAQEACIYVLSVPETFDLDRFKDLVKRFSPGYLATKNGLNNLLRFSFVEEVEEGRYSLHALVRKGLEERHDQEERTNIHQHLFHSARQILERDEIVDEYRTALREGVHHGEFCLDSTSFLDWFAEAAGRLNKDIDWYLLEALEENILSYAERVLGYEHPYTLASVSRLAGIFKAKVDYSAAERLYSRALEGRERVLGLEHPETLDSVNNLGVLFYARRDLTKAELLCRRALEGRMRVLGPEDIDTFTAMSNLATVLEAKGTYSGVERLYRIALDGFERILGLEDPATLSIVNNLGFFLNCDGKYAEAELFYRRALEGRERVLGLEHPETIRSANNLGALFYDKKDYVQAELFFRRSLEGWEHLLGEDHPDTLIAANNLGYIYRERKDYASAELLYRRVLESRQRVLGPEHPYTEISRSILESFLEEIRLE